MKETLVWIVGSGGLLGSHMAQALNHHVPRARVWQFAPRLSWTDPPSLARDLERAVASFASAAHNQEYAWAVLWCAGRGTVASPAAALETEWGAWTRLLELLGHHLAERNHDLPGYVFLASSAGGVYGGNAPQLLTEHTEPLPASAYGTHKLRMEDALRRWADTFSHVSCLIGRISTLYGPGQDLRKAQGIISHLSRCLLYRRPVSIYVPLDTRRDYLFVDDCADQIAASLARVIAERPQSLIKIFASERLTSLAQILGVFFRISKHRSLIAPRQAASRQATTLKFRSEVWCDLKGVRMTDLAAGIHLLHQHQLSMFQQGLLPPPT
jgi:UDP-glucose 4-epimerase